MALSIILSFIGEGPTDDRFFPNITERLIEQLLLAQNIQATIQWQKLEKVGNNVPEILLNAARQAKYSTTLIIHSDSDNRSHQETLIQKLNPSLDAIETSDEDICKNITVVIPITETEAWMLVDKDLLKEEINSTLSNQTLGLTYATGRIELIADPKQRLIDIIHIHHQHLPRRRRKNSVDISELYEPISQRIDLRKLETLSAYRTFKNDLITALRNKKIFH